MLLSTGLWTVRLPAPAVKLSGIKRWLVLNVCVTDPRLTNETEAILLASGVSIVMFDP